MNVKTSRAIGTSLAVVGLVSLIISAFALAGAYRRFHDHRYVHPQHFRSDFYAEVNKARRGDLIVLPDGEVLVILAGPQRVSPGLTKSNVSLDDYPNLVGARIVTFENRSAYDILAHDFFNQK